MKKTIKIFKLNDADWYAAETLDYAIQCCAETINNGDAGTAFMDEYIDSPYEVSERDMNRYTIRDEEDEFQSDNPRIPTFRKHLDEMIAKGEKFPCFFASSEY